MMKLSDHNAAIDEARKSQRAALRERLEQIARSLKGREIAICPGRAEAAREDLRASLTESDLCGGFRCTPAGVACDHCETELVHYAADGVNLSTPPTYIVRVRCAGCGCVGYLKK